MQSKNVSYDAANVSEDEFMDIGQLLAMKAKFVTKVDPNRSSKIPMKKLGDAMLPTLGLFISHCDVSVYQTIAREANAELDAQRSPIRIEPDFSNRNFLVKPNGG